MKKPIIKVKASELVARSDFALYSEYFAANTAAKVEAIKKIWRKGMSARDIAEKLPFSMTRNAVIGFFERHPDELFPAQLRSRKTVEAKLKNKAALFAKPDLSTALVLETPRVLEEPVMAQEPLHLSLMDLGPRCCNFPYGDRNFTFCGHPVVSTSSTYCEHHAKISSRAAARVEITVESALAKYNRRKIHREKLLTSMGVGRKEAKVK